MKLIITALFAVFTLVLAPGCTKQEVKEGAKQLLCDSGKAAATVVAVQITAELSCSNIAAIKASIEEKLISLKVCEKPEEKGEGIVAKSAVGNLVCGTVVEGLFAGGMSQLPKEWGCTGGPLLTEAKIKIIEACKTAL